MPTDMAVMLTTLPTGVSSVVTTMKNTGKSAAAWTVVPVPPVEEAVGPQGCTGWVWRKENLSSTGVYTSKHSACSQLLYCIYHPRFLWCKVQTFLLLPEEYVLWLNTLN
jgi:hypothetical protein